ncbi:hypothetical protein Micbo1qcDRAFT_32065 [Microdochium bolleyi]|uniref:Uncharacterized protein n=1 Tax=Microdochium bolleyi TaxID=196109 RepID=A0A136IQ58_9PEZI|nr:hypothetical protein Micbo1qcDRAFT_32065 [Microdochium bolleyi]
MRPAHWCVLMVVVSREMGRTRAGTERLDRPRDDMREASAGGAKEGHRHVVLVRCQGEKAVQGPRQTVKLWSLGGSRRKQVSKSPL